MVAGGNATTRTMQQNHASSTLLASLGFLLAMSAAAQVDLQAGLIAYYPFNGNADDASGNGNHGTVMGAQLTADRFGWPAAAYLFNGSSHYITIPGSSSLDSPDTALTMSAWLLFNGTSQSGTTSMDPVLMKSDQTANGFMYRMDCTPAYVSAATGNWLHVTDIDTANVLGTWYLITVAMSPDTARIYINDALVATNAYTPLLTPDGRPLEIGRDMPGGIEFFNGIIDEVRIYDRALSADEAAALYDFATAEEGLSAQGGAPSFVAVAGGVRVDARAGAWSAQGIDPSGRMIASHSSSSKDAAVLPVPTSGLYVVTCRTAQGVFSRKLFVER